MKFFSHRKNYLLTVEYPNGYRRWNIVYAYGIVDACALGFQAFPAAETINARPLKGAE